MKAGELHHEPPGYRCPFCRFALGEFDEHNASTDLVARTDHAIARISPKWWPGNPGHVLVSPIEHPRYEDDHLYSRHGEAAYVPPEARAPFGALLRPRFLER
ncbi:histidine triad (HIT) family protein [Rhodococcus sp. OAS809]|uniref:hypothetical protein n=1 Tax=Rhodococcus sp. OAS809 TaxID=2663874 RepID=UPI0017897784|nr:hypothetical protein [Rhodococcus qingshengii]